MSDELFLQTLKKYFGYDSFRSIQLDIVRSISSGYDTLGLMPTGGGKSITFQVPALTMEGVCIVVTPLISLMKDQVQHLKDKGIKADYIHSGLSRMEIQKVLDNTIYGAIKFLYVSPERLSQKLFLAKLYYMKVCFITVDEAHCISQWGYDFRPSYLTISKIREEIPDVPVLALTATATPLVVHDIQEKLQFGKFSKTETNVFQMSFKRENISYVVRRTEDKFAEMIHILTSVNGSAIIYTRNREKTKEVSRLLNETGISADFYHAGLDFAIKDKRQQRWQNNEIRVMVATNAFGMGIDKPDVRVVIHIDCPDSLEAYFQEAGRAGRDGKRSFSVLLYNNLDRSNLLRHCTLSFPEKEYIKRVYDHLAYFFELAVDTGEGARYEFNKSLFCARFKHNETKLESALSILQNGGYIHYDSDPDSKPRIIMNVMREELYHVNNISPTEEKVLTTLLRYYGTLFTDFTYFDDMYIARKCGIDEDLLHTILVELAQKRIIRYVPRRKIPIITYLQQRIESSRIRISKDIYETLQERQQERINAVLNYAEACNKCRETMLMSYFGEKSLNDCGHCDNCLTNKEQHISADYTDMLRSLLSDKQRHSVGELAKLGIPRQHMTEFIESLRNNDEFLLDGTFISLRYISK
ncbi:MAG: RecQ family ATP-dependent DNA helicase [Prevotella sp.]|nr:RecQ family ATP-dependent DNA helicase [Candidatus Prevotella equi]